MEYFIQNSFNVEKFRRKKILKNENFDFFAGIFKKNLKD